jgi:hypothetical protein
MIVSEWLRDCNQNHPSCRAVPKTRTLPTRLVDVIGIENGLCRLIETESLDSTAQEKLQYVALSHPWGVKGPRFFCTKENITRLMEGFPASELPATLRDAVCIVRNLEIRYLWVDALCIIYRSNDFERESARIPDVFSGAYCAIAASSAFGMSSGFLQPRQKSRFAALTTSSKVDGNDSIYISNLVDDFGSDVLQATLHNRGWTLQERALARRTIYFAKNQTYFECGEGIRCEILTKLQK